MLLTNEQQRLPPIGSVKDSGMRLFDALAVVKLFTPGDKWIWYVVEFDGEDLCFGFIVGNVPELGYFRLSSLQKDWARQGLTVIRDQQYCPVLLRALLQKYLGLHIVDR